jgi:hypothetical protein
MIVVTHDTTALTDLALAAYGRALEPKSLAIMPGGHYIPYLEGFEGRARLVCETPLRRDLGGGYIPSSLDPE